MPQISRSAVAGCRLGQGRRYAGGLASQVCKVSPVRAGWQAAPPKRSVRGRRRAERRAAPGRCYLPPMTRSGSLRWPRRQRRPAMSVKLDNHVHVWDPSTGHVSGDVIERHESVWVRKIDGEFSSFTAASRHLLRHWTPTRSSSVDPRDHRTSSSSSTRTDGRSAAPRKRIDPADRVILVRRPGSGPVPAGRRCRRARRRRPGSRSGRWTRTSLRRRIAWQIRQATNEAELRRAKARGRPEGCLRPHRHRPTAFSQVDVTAPGEVVCRLLPAHCHAELRTFDLHVSGQCEDASRPPRWDRFDHTNGAADATLN